MLGAWHGLLDMVRRTLHRTHVSHSDPIALQCIRCLYPASLHLPQEV